MGLYINTNINSLIAQRNLFQNTLSLSASYERLSTGYRINRAADDAAGLSISQSLQAQINGLNQANNNAQDGINVLNIADGALGTVTGIVQRIRELTVQAASDTNGSTQRTAIANEIDNQLKEIDRIANGTQFNGVKLLNNNAPATFNLQVGANASTSDYINVASAFSDNRASQLGFTTYNVDLSTSSKARTFLTTVDNVLDKLSNRRATIGSYTNRLSSVSDNLAISAINYASAQSRIRDVDVAAETSKLVRSQILQQASVSLLSQANQSAALLLSLITGR